MEYSKLDRDIINNKRGLYCQRKYGRNVAIGIVGGLIGGPIGLLISHGLHIGFGGSFIIEIISILGGITTSNIFNNRYYHNRFIITNKPSTGSYEVFRKCFICDDRVVLDNDLNKHINLEYKLSTFSYLIENDKWFKYWYQNIIKNYHVKNNKSDIHLIKVSLENMVGDIIKLLLDVNYIDNQQNQLNYQGNNSLSPETIIHVYTVCEHILMMSLYHEVYKISKGINMVMDNLYNKKASQYKQEILPSTDIINCLNTLADKKTATQKVLVLLNTCDLITKQRDIGCDDLLIAFVNNLVKSNIKYPFTEFLIIDTLLPTGLKGKESYALSTFQACIQYIATYDSV